MAIRIQTSFLMLISFWLGIIFTPLSLWLIIFEDSTESFDELIIMLVFGLTFSFSSIYYYTKVGWSNLGWESAGCIVSIILLAILVTLYDYFFS